MDDFPEPSFHHFPTSVLLPSALLLGSFPSAYWREERFAGVLVKISLNLTDH